MSDPTGLRELIEERVEADRARTCALMLHDQTVLQDRVLLIKTERLDAALTAVEALVEAGKTLDLVLPVLLEGWEGNEYHGDAEVLVMLAVVDRFRRSRTALKE